METGTWQDGFVARVEQYLIQLKVVTSVESALVKSPLEFICK